MGIKNKVMKLCSTKLWATHIITVEKENLRNDSGYPFHKFCDEINIFFYFEKWSIDVPQLVFGNLINSKYSCVW